MCALYFSVLLLYHSLKQKAIPRHSFLAGIDTYAKHVCWRRRDGGINTYAKHVCQFLDDPQRNIKKLFLQCSFRLSEKNEKDKKRKVLTPVSATRGNAPHCLIPRRPVTAWELTHMRSMCAVARYKNCHIQTCTTSQKISRAFHSGYFCRFHFLGFTAIQISQV